MLVLLLLAGCETPRLREGAEQPPVTQPSASTTPGQSFASPAPKEAVSNAPQEAASSAVAEASEPPPVVPEDMLLVPGGTFRMGADDEGQLDERPAHEVTVGAFLLDRTEVTNEKYLECVRAGACAMYDSLGSSRLTRGHPERFHLPNKPVVGVSWFDAQSYCAFKGRRLPTEAEWERAARGDDDRRYAWGNERPDPKRHGVFGGQAATRDVGSFPEGKGPFGHLDLAGNVWEWVADEYDPYAYRRPGAARGEPGSCEQIKAAQDELRRLGKQGYTGNNPIPFECERVLRGGAYNYRADGLRNSNRVHHPGAFRMAVAGFRCALDASSKRAG